LEWTKELTKRSNQDHNFLSKVSQMATYWFVIAWFDNQSVQKSKVRQVVKDLVKSKVNPQTYSS